MAGGLNYSGACGMSYCALPVYFRPGSLCINTRAKAGRGRGVEEEVEGGKGTKAPNLQGHLSKIENVNNETSGNGVCFGFRD